MYWKSIKAYRAGKTLQSCTEESDGDTNDHDSSTSLSVVQKNSIKSRLPSEIERTKTKWWEVI